MSKEQTNKPEADQESVSKAPEKKERNYNGIYRRNSRLKKNEKERQEKDMDSISPSNDVAPAEVIVASDISIKPKTKILKPRFKKETDNTPTETEDLKSEDLKSEETNEQQPSSKKIVRKTRTKKSEENNNQSLEAQEIEDKNVDSSEKQDNKTDIATPEPVIEEPVVAVRSVFHELLYLIRQKNAYNHNEFFLELNKVLEVMSFDNIRESNLSLFGFACMYDREIIFQKLCEDYANFITQEDLESILKICFTKREETVGNLIKVYNGLFKPSPEFIQQLFVSMSISSYRENNNIQILNWLAPYITDAEYDVFWNNCVEYRNISLMNTALHVPSIKEHLQRNFNKYLDGFKKIGREHTIAAALNREHRQIQVAPITQVTVANAPRKSYLADNAEQLKSIQQDEEGKQPVVVFKPPRKGTEA